MNRETLIAIFLGFAGGILIAFLLITLPKRLPQAKKENLTPAPAKQTQEDKKIIISIESPENESLVEGEEVEVKGTTKEKSLIVISGPNEDKVVTSGDDGKFSTKLVVYEGQNLITFTLYLEDGTLATHELTVFASKETL